MMEKFVQTVSSVNYNKGVFSLYFVGQDQKIWRTALWLKAIMILN